MLEVDVGHPVAGYLDVLDEDAVGPAAAHADLGAPVVEDLPALGQADDAGTALAVAFVQQRDAHEAIGGGDARGVRSTGRSRASPTPCACTPPGTPRSAGSGSRRRDRTARAAPARRSAPPASRHGRPPGRSSSPWRDSPARSRRRPARTSAAGTRIRRTGEAGSSGRGPRPGTPDATRRGGWVRRSVSSWRSRKAERIAPARCTMTPGVRSGSGGASVVSIEAMAWDLLMTEAPLSTNVENDRHLSNVGAHRPVHSRGETAGGS